MVKACGRLPEPDTCSVLPPSWPHQSTPKSHFSFFHSFAGPTIRVKQGQRVYINFQNNVPLPTKNSTREQPPCAATQGPVAVLLGSDGCKSGQPAGRPWHQRAVLRQPCAVCDGHRLIHCICMHDPGPHRAQVCDAAVPLTPPAPACNQHPNPHRGLVQPRGQGVAVAEAFQWLRPPALCW